MAETSDAIKAHIDRERKKLEMNFQEVERRASTKWRHWRKRMPPILFGVAAAVGLVLGLRART
jgi:hypothetical protein